MKSAAPISRALTHEVGPPHETYRRPSAVTTPNNDNTDALRNAIARAVELHILNNGGSELARLECIAALDWVRATLTPPQRREPSSASFLF
jgi:hypothetical protein